MSEEGFDDGGYTPQEAKRRILECLKQCRNDEALNNGLPREYLAKIDAAIREVEESIKENSDGYLQ